MTQRTERNILTTPFSFNHDPHFKGRRWESASEIIHKRRLSNMGLLKGSEFEISSQKPEYQQSMESLGTSPKCVFILLPHADDQEFTAATALQFDPNVRVIYVLLTDGSEGTGPYSRRHRLTTNQLIEQRIEEDNSAMEKLAKINPHISVVEIDRKSDMQLSRYHSELIPIIGELAKQEGVDFMIFPNGNLDYHPDHRAAGKIGLEVARRMNITAYYHDTQFGKIWDIPSGTLLLDDQYQQMNTAKYFRSIKEHEGYYEGRVLVAIPYEVMWQTQEILETYISQFHRTRQNLLRRIAESKAIRGQWIGETFAETFEPAFQSTKSGAVADPFPLILPSGAVWRRVEGI